jgi:hypothetical protein
MREEDFSKHRGNANGLSVQDEGRAGFGLPLFLLCRLVNFKEGPLTHFILNPGVERLW